MSIPKNPITYQRLLQRFVECLPMVTMTRGGAVIGDIKPELILTGNTLEFRMEVQTLKEWCGSGGAKDYEYACERMLWQIMLNSVYPVIPDSLITVETFKLAKSKGFELLSGRWPTQTSIQKWLRETHSIFVVPQVQQNSWDCSVCSPSGEKIHVISKEDVTKRTYEEALEIGLVNGIDNVA